MASGPFFRTRHEKLAGMTQYGLIWIIIKACCPYPWYIPGISPKSLKSICNILKKSSTIVNQIFKNHPKNNTSSANPQRGGCGGSRIPGYGKWGQPDPRAGGPPLLRICRWFVVFQKIFEDSLTIVDDFVRILERVSRYFGDIYRFNIKIMKTDYVNLI